MNGWLIEWVSQTKALFEILALQRRKSSQRFSISIFGKKLRIYAGPSRYSIVKVILSYCAAYSSFETKYRMQRQCVNTKVHINFFSYKTKYMLSWNINFEVTFREMRWVCALFMAFRASALFMVFLCQTSFPSFLLRMGCWPGKDKSEYFVKIYIFSTK